MGIGMYYLLLLCSSIKFLSSSISHPTSAPSTSLTPPQTAHHGPPLQSYDILSLQPLTSSTFSTACLVHTPPSQTSTNIHLITIPLHLPRIPYYLKHTLVKTAIRNGASFEISYGGALGHSLSRDGGTGGGGGQEAKMNWWAAVREIVRVTKGKGVALSSGVEDSMGLRGPRDVANL
jgi:ribonuclease P/MRP protein subunit RPP1